MSSAELAAQRVDPGAFDFPASGRAAALCLHGLTGTPYEVRSLGVALAGAGIRALGPVLPGHGGAPAVLRRTPYTAWLEAAREHARTLRREYDVVFGVGLSMGGLVTLQLAAEQVFDAIVCVGVPLRLRQPGVGLAPLLKYVVPETRKRGGSDICEPTARERHPSMPVMPLAAVAELQKLQRQVAASLAQVEVPILAAHGALDRTAFPGDARAILQRVGSAERDHLLLERSGHIVPVDYDAAQLASAVVGFLAGRMAPSARNKTSFC